MATLRAKSIEPPFVYLPRINLSSKQVIINTPPPKRIQSNDIMNYSFRQKFKKYRPIKDMQLRNLSQRKSVYMSADSHPDGQIKQIKNVANEHNFLETPSPGKRPLSQSVIEQPKDFTLSSSQPSALKNKLWTQIRSPAILGLSKTLRLKAVWKKEGRVRTNWIKKRKLKPKGKRFAQSRFPSFLEPWDIEQPEPIQFNLESNS